MQMFPVLLLFVLWVCIVIATLSEALQISFLAGMLSFLYFYLMYVIIGAAAACIVIWVLIAIGVIPENVLDIY